jgi:uncharacterized membrane protein
MTRQAHPCACFFCVSSLKLQRLIGGHVMATAEDNKVFEIVNTVLLAPIFFFLALVMFNITVWAVLHAAANPNNLLLGCVVFVLCYNAFRFGKKLRGACNAGMACAR